MAPINNVILCLAYILGLVSTGVPWRIFGFSLGGIGLFALSVGAMILMPRLYRSGIQPKIWLLGGLIGLVASLYLQVQTPRPGAKDISHLIPATEGSPQAQVIQGKVISTPRLTRSQRAQFWLEVTELKENSDSNTATYDPNVTGKLYVTVPLLQATGLNPGQRVEITGSLYKPKPASNPRGFDFQAYLAREGGFAGLRGYQVDFLAPPTWGWWAVRRRIIQSQIRWLDSPAGPLVSSMVLGSRVVDLPYELRDQFAQSGLAHALAASGFQVSLILSVVLALSQRLSTQLQFGLGLSALGIFVGLTGIQASVLRAAIMGVGALTGLVMQRKTKPLSSLLVAATILLLLNPHWIWDLGFQLSFLATLGLLVTVPALTKHLDWLPPTIAALIAVPIAAYLWTLPLQLYAFGLVSPYSILVNVITTPFISIISLGGIFSALVSLAWPLAGSATAWLLYYPTHWLIAIVEFFSKLPGAAIAVGTISVLQLIVLYALIGFVWLWPWWQKRGWLAGLVAISLVVLPAWQTQATLFRINLLATSEEPILIIQDKGRVALFNSGNETTAGLTVLPFLQQQGINQLDWAFALNQQAWTERSWQKILERVPVKILYAIGPLTPSSRSTQSASSQIIWDTTQSQRRQYQIWNRSERIDLAGTSVNLLNRNPLVVEWQILGQRWMYLGPSKLVEQSLLLKSIRLPQAQVFWWSGGPLTKQLLKIVQPEVAIASAPAVDPATTTYLRQSKTQLYWTGRHGALQWTPQQGFETVLEPSENNRSLL